MTKTIYDKYALRRSAVKMLLFLAASIIVITIASEFSPLSPFSRSRDANAFISSAMLMKNGKILYRDFFEQKGPALYFLYIAGLSITPGSLTGMFVLECAAAFANMIYSYKTAKTICPELSDAMRMTGVIAGCASMYLNCCIWGGGEVEEFCLPAYAYAMCLTARALCDDKSIESIKAYEIISAGIQAGAILWSKYLALAAYLGCIVIIMAAVTKKQIRTLIRSAGLFIIGAVIITIPVMAYLIATGSLGGMVDIYIIENTMRYSVRRNSLLECILRYTQCNMIQIISIGACVMAITRKHIKNARGLASVMLAYMITAVIIFMTRCEWMYYYMPLCAFNAIFLCGALSMFENSGRKDLRLLAAMISVVLVTRQYFDNDEIRPFIRSKDVYQEYSSAAEILKTGSFLVIDDLDDGLYWLSGRIPDEYYFIRCNARTEIIDERYREIIRSGGVDFIAAYDIDDINDKIRALDIDMDMYEKYAEERNAMLEKGGYELRRSFGLDDSLFVLQIYERKDRAGA